MGRDVMRGGAPRRSLTLYAGTITATVVAGVLLTSLTRAQGPGGPGGFGGPPPGPPGQGGFAPGQGPGRGGFGRMPFVIGRVSGGDVNAGIITVQSQFGGQAQAVRVTQGTQFVTPKQVSVSDLQVGDPVQVQGLPTAITANAITAGQPPAGLPGGAGPGGQGGPVPPGAPGGQGGPGGGPGMMGGPPAMAAANGRVTSTSPLTIALNGDVSIVIKTTASTRITKIVPTSLNQLKAGDNIIASGTPNQDGSFNATSVGVNMMPGGGPGFGPGGFGGRGFGGARGGFRGPGGPGGPVPPGAPGGPPAAPGDGGPPPTK